MKVLLDIKDEKATFVLEVLKNFKFVKAQPFTNNDNRFFEELKEAVEEVNLYKTGKIKGRPLTEVLDDL